MIHILGENGSLCVLCIITSTACTATGELRTENDTEHIAAATESARLSESGQAAKEQNRRKKSHKNFMLGMTIIYISFRWVLATHSSAEQ